MNWMQLRMKKKKIARRQEEQRKCGVQQQIVGYEFKCLKKMAWSGLANFELYGEAMTLVLCWSLRLNEGLEQAMLSAENLAVMLN